ncbi:helix-turn-helix domain-containing protein [Erythrobacter sp. WH158]|uniref:Helix-turn-helix domain-containing protein n=1 Tax=Erythrobacter crassostreae TaxID=2828328 RepID=A0A9X1F390_9SPHN|nr:helix-turn-helix domain-containing protein [Erythrobacter crassostrea]
MTDPFRRKKEPRHTRLFHSVTGSEAWLALSGNAVKVLIALARHDDGSSNGRIYFSERTGAKATGLSRNTVRRCLNELMEKGFIAQTKPGAFNRNNLSAATYRLTWVAAPGCSPSAPTRDFERWKDGNSQAQLLTSFGSKSDTCMETRARSGSIPDTVETETSHVSNFPAGSDSAPQTVYQVGDDDTPETKRRKQANPPSGVDLAKLRQRLVDYLRASEPGHQSRLAKDLEVPGGTLSKFINGRNLPASYHDRLARALERQGPDRQDRGR